GPKDKKSQSGSSKGTKSPLKSSGKSVQSEEPEFEVADSDMPQDQEENLGNDDVEPKEKALKTWFLIYGFLLKFPMINMHYGESYTRENNVEVTRKHGYGYLKDIVVRRSDNVLYRFKEGDFPRLRVNDIEDMLLLVVQNRLTNILGDDVSDFAIALRMPQTTISGIRKRDPYTPYQDPQRFIYVNNNGRNRLIRSDELYKFSDRTLTGLQTSLDDITKNIRMEYLPKRRWSTLEKKRANSMIKVIDKQLKERRLMRSLEKFVGGRDYGTDLRLLQRTI
ncbi:hypothetical protein Tco_0986085, partial [Tanacetum coccineum]